MRRLLTALAALTAVVLLPLLGPGTAAAVPAPDLCTPDNARGGGADAFALAACADGESITVRNDLQVAVLVRRDGDLGAPVWAHKRGSAGAEVLRRASADDVVLMPGEVARFPLGTAAASLTVADVDSATAAVLRALGPYLPALGGEDGSPADLRRWAVAVRESAAAIDARADCVDGKNFLQVSACDVTAASAISRTFLGHVPRATAMGLFPSLLDKSHWAEWATPPRTELAATAPSRRVITQTAVPVPVVVPPPVETPAPPAPQPPAPAAPAVPAPAVVVPAPAPVPPAPAAPAATPQVPDWLAQILARIAAEAEKAQAEQNNGNGNGRGNGNGNGNGRGGD